MPTYMILGGGGMLGVQMALYLLAHASHVHVVSVGRNPERPPAFSLHRGIDDSRYEYHQLHIAYEAHRLQELLEAKRPEVIINFAAQGEEGASWTDSWRYFDTNAVALAKIVEPLIDVPWLKKWVQIGTSAVYGSFAGTVTEEHPLRPSTPYAASKAAADFYLASVSRVRNFPVNILRPSNLYGPGQQLHRIIPKTILCALLGRKLALHGGGMSRKSYLYAEDLSRAARLAAEHGPSRAVYNVGPKDATSIRALVERVCEKVGLPLQQVTQVSPGRMGEESPCVLDSSLIASELGWSQQVDLDEGLDRTIDWVKQHLDFLKNQPTEFVLQP